ncbi:11179_t:CDS:2 [Diversispora eburnea]|uniref:ATP synthase subunit 5, mitochondrial n=1 Tax=Diversispora eburnea TaxID=1213867 RepID=A0A9N9C8T0_9GLOM|nr:11179_t:CDS:2 [Diversispora eburnea]
MSLLNLTNLTRKTVISLPKPPITLHGIEGRYATALYTAATKSNTLSNVENELKQIKLVINKDSKIRALLEDPSLNRNDKKRTVQELLKQGKYCDTTKNLFDLLADNGRLNESSKIIDAYISLMTAHRGGLMIELGEDKTIDLSVASRIAKLNKLLTGKK